MKSHTRKERNWRQRENVLICHATGIHNSYVSHTPSVQLTNSEINYMRSLNLTLLWEVNKWKMLICKFIRNAYTFFSISQRILSLSLSLSLSQYSCHFAICRQSASRCLRVFHCSHFFFWRYKKKITEIFAGTKFCVTKKVFPSKIRKSTQVLCKRMNRKR